MSCSPAEAVFATGELLEIILLDIDTHTLLVSAPRVCRQWHHVISSSLPLQQSLFFLPSHARDISSPGARQQQQNPLLRKQFPPWFSSASPSESADAADPMPSSFLHLPLYATFFCLPLFVAGTSSPQNPFLYPCASWRRMLTSQPPSYTIAVCKLQGCSTVGSAAAARVVRLRDGLRMGDLYDATLLHGMKSESSRFLVVWPRDSAGGGDGHERLASFFRESAGGVLPRKLEFSLALAWQKKPDLVIALARGEGLAEGEVLLPVDDLRRFWARCGSGFVGSDVLGSWDAARRSVVDSSPLMMAASSVHLTAE